MTTDTMPSTATTPDMQRSAFASPTLWLIVVNVGVWLYLGLQGVGWISPAPDDLTAWGGNLGPYTLSGEWTRLLTSMFLHAGSLHLALNMFMLSQIGPLSEAIWGRTRFLLIYLLSGVSGGLASAWWYSHKAPGGLERTDLQLAFDVAPTIVTTVSVGASGALLGAAGALLMLALNKGEEAHVDLKVIAQVVLLNIGLGFMVNGTDNAAHVGGAVAGLVIAAFLLMPGERLRIGARLQSAVVFAAAALILGMLALRPASPEVAKLADTLRAVDAEEARRAAQQARRERANDVARVERASLPAPVSPAAASGTSVTLEGSYAGQALRPGARGWYAADAASNRIARIGVDPLRIERSWPGPRLPADKDSGCMDNLCRGVGAAGVAAARDGKWAIATSLVTDAVSRIDLASGEILWSVPVSRFPRTVFLSDNEKYAFAIHGPENLVSVIDIAQQKVVAALPVGAQATQMPFGRHIAAAQGKGILYVGDLANNAVYTIGTEAPGKLQKFVDTGDLSPYLLALSADGAKLFVWGEKGMQVLDTGSRERSDEFFSCADNAIPPFAVNGDGSWIAVDSPYQDQISIVSVASGRVVRVLHAPGQDRTMAFAPDGKSLLTLASNAREETTLLTRFDLSKSLNVAAEVERHGEYFCEPRQQAESVVFPPELYRGMLRGLE